MSATVGLALLPGVPSVPSGYPQPDAVVIGAGSGGLTVAVGLSSFGKRVRLIERAQVGGDCTNVGCIPSKALLHASALLGSAQPNQLSPVGTLAHVRRRRNHLRDEETSEFAKKKLIDLQFGTARILESGKVEVTGDNGATELIEAKHIIVATGSRPRRIPIEGLPAERYLTNEEIFEVEEPPNNLVIVGAGPVGLEMATAFRRLGTSVTVLEAAPQILPAVLPEAAAVLHRRLEADGIDLKPGMVAKRFDPAGNTLHVGPLAGGATGRVEDVDAVLVAVGRLPNSEGLGLEELGVETGHDGKVVVDGKGATSVENIWATGDVSTKGATTHAANAWGRRIIKAIVFPIAPAGKEPEHPAVTFTSPEVATIGVQPTKVPTDVRRVTYDLAKADRAYVDEVTDGIVVVDVRRFSGKILGATIVGPRAGELISVFSLAMKTGTRFQKWYGVVWPYPVYAQALGNVVDQFMLEHMKNLHKDFPRWLFGRLRRS